MIFFKTHYKELYNYIEDSQLYEKFISNKINNHTILLTFVNLKVNLEIDGKKEEIFLNIVIHILWLFT